MKRVVHKAYIHHQETLDKYLINFDSMGENYGNQNRNSLKLFELDGKLINAKSFKVPNIVNKLVYRFFRKSKAQRSFEYASRLLEMGIGTPQPIAYYEFPKPLTFFKSYYVSEQIKCDFTYRDLNHNFEIESHEAILRAFTRFTFDLHQKEVHFLDHSPGNTLIQIKDEGYNFLLVDLNRMEFRPLDLVTRIKNFSRLTPHKEIVKIMSDEYAKCLGESPDKIFNLMWDFTTKFQEKYQRKKRLKKKLKFWKK